MSEVCPVFPRFSLMQGGVSGAEQGDALHDNPEYQEVDNGKGKNEQ